MKNYLFILTIIAALLMGCQPKNAPAGDDEPKSGLRKVAKDASSKKKKKKSLSLLPRAGGTPYELLVIMGNEQWERPVGRALFEVLDTDLPGVAQPERQFRMSRIDPSSYHGMFKIFRNILKVDVQNIYSSAKLKYARDTYARTQMIVTLQAHDEQQLTEFIEANGQQILDFFTRVELNREIMNLEEQHNKVVSEMVQTMFGCDVWIPLELDKYKKGKDFLWASTYRGSKDLNFVMYSYPYTDPNTFTPEYYMARRDSVMKANIPGGPEGSYMTTQHKFVEVQDITVKGEYAQFARGLWRVQGDFMGGPFVAMSRVDVPNNRVVVVEGFVYAPEPLKRNLIRKMEAVLYTLQLPTEQNVENFIYGLEEITIEPGKE